MLITLESVKQPPITFNQCDLDSILFLSTLTWPVHQLVHLSV